MGAYSNYLGKSKRLQRSQSGTFMACIVSILKSIRQIFDFQVYMHRVCYLKAVQANALLALLSKEIKH